MKETLIQFFPPPHSPSNAKRRIKSDVNDVSQMYMICGAVMLLFPAAVSATSYVASNISCPEYAPTCRGLDSPCHRSGTPVPLPDGNTLWRCKNATSVTLQFVNPISIQEVNDRERGWRLTMDFVLDWRDDMAQVCAQERFRVPPTCWEALLSFAHHCDSPNTVSDVPAPAFRPTATFTEASMGCGIQSCLH